MTKLEQSIVDEYKFCLSQAQRGYQPNLNKLLDKILINQFDVDKSVESKLISYVF